MVRMHVHPCCVLCLGTTGSRLSIWNDAYFHIPIYPPQESCNSSLSRGSVLTTPLRPVWARGCSCRLQRRRLLCWGGKASSWPGRLAAAGFRGEWGRRAYCPPAKTCFFCPRHVFAGWCLSAPSCPGRWSPRMFKGWSVRYSWNMSHQHSRDFLEILAVFLTHQLLPVTPEGSPRPHGDGQYHHGGLHESWGGLVLLWIAHIRKVDRSSGVTATSSQSDACARESECRGRPALQGQAGVRRLESGGCGTDMGSTGEPRSICSRRGKTCEILFSAEHVDTLVHVWPPDRALY